MSNELSPCPLCGNAVKLAEINIESDDVCTVYSAKIECGCGLSFEREWTEMKAKNGHIKLQEDIFTVWNEKTDRIVKKSMLKVVKTMLECFRRNSKNLNKIKIKQDFIDNAPNPEKVIKKTADFLNGGKLNAIYVDREWNLIDGYCSYLIAKTLESRKVKIIQVRENKNK